MHENFTFVDELVTGIRWDAQYATFEGHWKPLWVRLKGGPEAADRPSADYVAPTCSTCSTATPESPVTRSHLTVVPA
ncbi:hypothetical protein AVL48_14600 [Amycolatopsis regifaucium]|uniref:Uncharacterized protein n=1 Tax=Amycolatopsis regifaucium TaxID=546365 RepID=A0A154M4W9_9PSEU|nr:hypothetical protein AVL48_14600 [Amycolatopsis regifaucium]OKA10041.1 hypothetical protein ATP06_0206815 [Amycolatopsis regifaucium]SFI63814.1 hypothetical protein SAMN04489731_11225 [Amycolatopsis regifaucium]